MGYDVINSHQGWLGNPPGFSWRFIAARIKEPNGGFSIVIVDYWRVNMNQWDLPKKSIWMVPNDNDEVWMVQKLRCSPDTLKGIHPTILHGYGGTIEPTVPGSWYKDGFVKERYTPKLP